MSTSNPESPVPAEQPAQITHNANRLAITDYLLLVVYCAMLFGYVAISGRPMTLHEARLPETSREMLARHDWLLPMDGDRPWLERPPFPHWCMMAVARLIGQRCDNEWSCRIPPALCGLLIVLMASAMAAGWFGRGIGLVSGLLLASMYEFYSYSTHAEDDIFLALLVVGAVALFVRLEFFTDPEVTNARLGFAGWRPLPVLGFFFLLGLTNLAKGPVVGAAVVIGTILAYFLMPTLAWQGQDLAAIFPFQPAARRRWRRYFWLWGILLASVVALSWHVYMARLYRGVGGYLDNLHYDFSLTHEFDEPFWYYPVNLLSRGLPWTPAAVVALFLTARQAWIERDAVMRFLWCWAIVPIVVLSIPHRKHHHYLVPSLAPWAILAALGLKAIAKELYHGPAWSRTEKFGLLAVGVPVTIVIAICAAFRLLSPDAAAKAQIESAGILVVLLVGCVLIFYRGLSRASNAWMLAALLIGFGGAYAWTETHLRDETVPDTLFLKNQVNAAVPTNELLAVDAEVGPLDFFRVQFYLRSSAKLLHNLSYLRSDQIHSADAYVVTKVQNQAALNELGTATLIARSPRRHQQNVPDLALFHVVFAPNLKRYPPPPVNPMQAMMRQSGPWCGPPLKTQ